MQVGGKIAMIPRYANGVWWSRWYNYNNGGMKYIVDSYRSRSVPLDGELLPCGLRVPAFPLCRAVSPLVFLLGVRPRQCTSWTWTGTPRTT